MPINNLANGESTEDDIYLAKLTMDEVVADIEEHGHVAVTSENRTQDPFTTKGSLANALDEAIPVDASNDISEKKDSSGEDELHGEIDGDETSNKPDMPAMDRNGSKTAKGSLMEALDAVAMDAKHTDTKESIKVEELQENEIGDADTPMDDTDKKWLKQRDEAMKPELPKSLGDTPNAEDDGLVYLEYTFTIDPTKYRSNNYQPIANVAEAGKNKNVSVGGAREPEKPEEAEQIEVAEVEEKKSEDEAPEKGVLDYAIRYDGSSFLCFDEVDGIDYTKIAMDASPKTPNTKPNCKTTFAQCRAKNPLYCRFHGPKLLEKDIKQALTALLGKNNCTVSITKDKDSKNPMTFRLTVGCVPSMKEKVEDMVHKFMTQNPGIKSKEDWKDLGEKGGKIMETEEFEIDILQADKPPKSSDWALQAKYDTEKAKEVGKKQAVVGDTPSNIEAIAKGEKPPMKDKPKKEGKPAKEDGKGEENSSGAEESKPNGISDISEQDIEEAANKPAAKPKAIAAGDYVKQFADLVSVAQKKKLFDDPDFKAKYASIYNSGDEMDKQVENLSALVKEFSEKKGNGDITDSMSQDIDKLESEMDSLYDRAKEVGLAEDEKIGEIVRHFNLMKEEGNIPEMNQAIVDLKSLMAQKEKESKGNASETSAYDKDYSEAETAMKSLTGDAADYLAMGHLDVDDAHSNLIASFNDIKYTKGNIEAIQKTISALDEEGNLSVSSAAKKKALLDGLKKFADHWPQALKHFNKAKETMTIVLNGAKEGKTDKMKAESAAKVEGIVKSVVKSLYPNGKPKGIESVAELIDHKESELNKVASENGISDKDLYDIKVKHDVFETYKLAANAAHDFDITVAEFKNTIDDVKESGGKEVLDKAVNEMSAKAKAMMGAMDAYSKAIKDAGVELEFGAELKTMGEPSKKGKNGDKEFSDASKEFNEYFNENVYVGLSDNDDYLFKVLPLKIKAEKGKSAEQMKEALAALKGVIEKHKQTKSPGEGEKKVYTKEMLAKMSPKEKLTAAIKIAKKKLAANPSDEGLKAKLAKWEKQLSAIG